MTNNLEIKYLAPYLPYSVKVFYKGGGEFNHPQCIGKLTQLDAEGKGCTIKRDTEPWNIDVHFRKTKPILRPLSDISNLIEHPVLKGQYKNWSVFLDLIRDESGEFGYRLEENPHSVSFPLGIVTSCNLWLFEWHFDVFGLIQDGLAISYKEAGIEYIHSVK